MQIQTLPRAAVTTSLHVMRLPLDVVERLARRPESDAEAWPPALAFESFEAQVKTIAGSVLRDDELTEQAEIQRARVATLRRAADLEAQAAAEQARADQEVEARRQEARDEAETAREERDAARRAADQRKAQAKQATKNATAQKKRAARSRATKAEQKTAEAATAARAETVAEKREALEEKQAAVAAERRARDLDATTDEVKARRQRRSA